MMDSKPVRNMYSSVPNKFEKQCILLVFIIRIYHDARSSECQIFSLFYKMEVFFYRDINLIWKVLNNWSSWCPGMWHCKRSEEISICEPTGSAKTLTPTYWTTLCQIPESRDINTRHQKNLNFILNKFYLYQRMQLFLSYTKIT